MPPVRRSSRVAIPALDGYLKEANRVQEDIEYKRALISAQAGSSKAVALLGPLSFRSRNSDANANLPSGIISARAKYQKAYFKAGHMINACFGGDGNSSNNLTILTGSANTSMTLYDNKVKQAVEDLHNLFVAFHAAKIDLSEIGTCRIKLKVTVSGSKWGASPPDSYIDEAVSIVATFEDIPPEGASDIYRSSAIRDSGSPYKNHTREIKKYQTRITSSLLQATGFVSNEY